MCSSLRKIHAGKRSTNLEYAGLRILKGEGIICFIDLFLDRYDFGCTNSPTVGYGRRYFTAEHDIGITGSDICDRVKFMNS